MRAVVQRVLQAQITVEQTVIASIGQGLLAFVGIAANDTARDIDYIVRKCIGLRIFDDCDGKMNASVQELGLSVLVVSQFTLMGDARCGRRPSFSNAETVESARAMYEKLACAFRETRLDVHFGQFQADMNVSLINSGPVTILLDSRKEF